MLANPLTNMWLSGHKFLFPLPPLEILGLKNRVLRNVGSLLSVGDEGLVPFKFSYPRALTTRLESQERP